MRLDVKLFKIEKNDEKLTVTILGIKITKKCRTKQNAEQIKKAWKSAEKVNFNNFKNCEIVKILDKSCVCIDCGANIGKISELFAKCGASVYAFEPNPLCFDALEKIVKKYPNINLIKKGVCNKNCTLKMYHNDLTNYDSEFFSQSSSICATKDNINTQNYTEIECIDLCEFIENLNKPIDILKMDIEGAEFDILEKMINKGLYKNIKHILVETHDATLPEI